MATRFWQGVRSAQHRWLPIVVSRTERHSTNRQRVAQQQSFTSRSARRLGGSLGTPLSPLPSSSATAPRRSRSGRRTAPVGVAAGVANSPCAREAWRHSSNAWARHHSNVAIVSQANRRPSRFLCRRGHWNLFSIAKEIITHTGKSVTHQPNSGQQARTRRRP